MIRTPSSFESEEQREACGRQLQECRKSICRMPVCGRPGGEDLYQEVCLRCVNRAADRDWHLPQYGFIHRIARRMAIDMHRRGVFRETVSVRADAVASEADGEAADVAIALESQEVLRQRIDRLPKSYRESLWDHFLSGQSKQAIANNRHLPFDTVKSRVRRGIQRLRSDPVLREYFANEN